MMSDGYHRLSAEEMDARDQVIIRLLNCGVKHKHIAMQVGLGHAGIESRLQKLREMGKLPVAGGNDG
jgi:DNA-binding NarL/FixJ family response regulator